MNEIQTNNYLKKLFNGEVPLAITFWVWFIILSSFLSLVVKPIEKIDFSLDFSLYLLNFIYTILIFVIVIKSANKYQGSKFFSFFAKIFVSLNLFVLLFTSIDLLKNSFFEDLAIESEIKIFQNQLPIQVNSYTLLEDIYKIDKNIVYKYKLINEHINNHNNLNINKFKQNVQNSLCEDENTLILLKKDYILEYTYVDKDNKNIVDIITKKQNCGPGIYDLEILKEILKNENDASL